MTTISVLCFTLVYHIYYDNLKQKRTKFEQKIPGSILLLAPPFWHTRAIPGSTCILLAPRFWHTRAYMIRCLLYIYNRCLLGLIWYIKPLTGIVWRCWLLEKFWNLIWQREGCYMVYIEVYNTCSTCLSYVCIMIPNVCIVWGPYNKPRAPYTPGAGLYNMQMKHSA